MKENKVKVLTAQKQKYTLAAKNKKKKVVKPSLKNPFALTLPNIEEEDHNDVLCLLKTCLAGNAKESFVFGFNVVMKGLEKGTVISVLVDQSTQPEILLNQFVKICSAKQLPLVKIKNLGKEVHTYIPKISKCSALGIKKDISQTAEVFKLYLKTCSILDLEPFNEKNATTPESILPVAPLQPPVKKKITAKRLEQLHLKRKDSNYRIFVP